MANTSGTGGNCDRKTRWVMAASLTRRLRAGTAVSSVGTRGRLEDVSGQEGRTQRAEMSGVRERHGFPQRERR